MKKFKLFSLILMYSSMLLLTISCQEGKSLVGPENTNTSTENQLDKKSKKVSDYTVKQLITVKTGGKITLKAKLKKGPFGKKAKISAEIKFSPNTVTEDTEFTMTLDPKTCMISFSPHMNFKDGKVAPLTISIKGVKPGKKKKKNNKDEIKFVYFDENGEEVYIDSKKIWFKKDSFGILQAEIPHFSRYGFTR